MYSRTCTLLMNHKETLMDPRSHGHIQHNYLTAHTLIWAEINNKIDNFRLYTCKLCTKSSEYCLRGYSSEINRFINTCKPIVLFRRLSIPFHMALIVSHLLYHDHNERYGPEKRGTERFWQISAGPHLAVLVWAVSFAVVMNNKWHVKWNWYTYKMGYRLIYKPINPRAIAPQRQYSELFVQNLYVTPTLLLNNHFSGTIELLEERKVFSQAI